MTTASDIIPAHQWTHDGTEVLILKCVPKDGRVTGQGNNGKAFDFAWPLTVGATVTAPDANRTPNCGGGLHGWPWGLGIGGGKEPDWAATWIVFAAKPDDVIDLDDKVKAVGSCRIAFVGDWQAATNHVLSGQIAWVLQASRGAASATGERGAASATGGRGAASATGERGAASATGWSGAASATGGRGAASATGLSGAASATGLASAAIATGVDGRVQCGPYGALALAWWNTKDRRSEMRVACAGCGDGSDGLLKARQWYRMDATGAFVECA